LIAQGTLAANDAREIQQEHLDKVLGRIGVVSNFLNNVIPPHIGAWVNASNLLVHASRRLSERDVESAMIGVVNGYTALIEAQQDWNDYVGASIGGAERTTAKLTSVRDTAIGVEIALTTGNVAAPFIGATGAFVAGTGVGVGVVSRSDSPAGEAVRGTVGEIARTGLYKNLVLAKQGLIGIAYGTGEGLSAIPGALIRLPATVDKLLLAAGDILKKLFTDPAKLVDDIVRLGEAVTLMYEALSDRWEWLERLPPELQALQVGRISGQIEAALIVLQAVPAGTAAGGNLASEALSGASEALSTLPRTALVGGASEGTSVALDASVTQLAELRAQLLVVAAKTGAVTTVAVAATVAGGGGGPGKGWWTTKKKPGQLRPGQIADYRQFRGQKGKVEGHEVLQNLWLEVQNVIKNRGKGVASRYNPSIALPPKVHDVVDRYQRALGLFDRAQMAKLSYKKVLALNALALQKAGVSQDIIEEILEEAFDHAVFSLARGY
jgi:hypothetical protein